MKIEFNDHSFIEIYKSINNDKVFITISARDSEKSLSTIINSVELTLEQFNNLIKLH